MTKEQEAFMLLYIYDSLLDQGTEEKRSLEIVLNTIPNLESISNHEDVKELFIAMVSKADAKKEDKEE